MGNFCSAVVQECKTNYPELIETKAECKTNYPELIETKAECKTNYSELIEHSECAGGGAGAITIDLCEGTIETGDNCNVGRPSAGWTSDACSQKYLRIGPEESNLAYQCTLGSGANCNSWGSGESPTFCRIPQ